MKPGEFVRWNGRSVRALMIQCRYQDGYEAIIGPDSPDYALAVAALQALIRPSLDPRAGRVLAMREDGPYRFIANEREYEVAADGWLTTNRTLAGCAIQTIFEAGRRYERERG